MLLRRVEAASRALGLAGGRVLVAASGGLDSTVLLCLLHELAEPLELELGVGHIHHGLRGAEADADAAFVETLAAKLGLPFRLERVDPQALRAKGPSRARPTLEEAGRRLRYAALRRLAAEAGAARLATAHTADDQAETVLLRLFRGTSPEGLGGIPERSPDGFVVRPLLAVPRGVLQRFALQRGLCWREDRSNRDPRFARNRLRALLPQLAESFNPRLLRALVDLAEAQRWESEWLNAWVDEEAAARFVPDGARALRVQEGGWEGLPEALARRLVRRALQRCGASRDVSRRHVERVLAFLRGGRVGTAIELPGGLSLTRTREGFRLGPRGLPVDAAC